MSVHSLANTQYKKPIPPFTLYETSNTFFYLPQIHTQSFFTLKMQCGVNRLQVCVFFSGGFAAVPVVFLCVSSKFVYLHTLNN